MNQLKWDIYFLKIAREIGKNSKCLSRKVGAVLVKEKNIISTGYNGPARGVKHCNERDIDFYSILDKKGLLAQKINECPRKIFGYKSGEGLHLCQAGHAERNALIQAAKHGITTNNATLYCYCGRPCKECMIEIINAGISELIYLKIDKEYDEYSGILLEESKIITRIINEKEIK